MHRTRSRRNDTPPFSPRPGAAWTQQHVPAPAAVSACAPSRLTWPRPGVGRRRSSST